MEFVDFNDLDKDKKYTAKFWVIKCQHCNEWLSIPISRFNKKPKYNGTLFCKYCQKENNILNTLDECYCCYCTVYYDDNEWQADASTLEIIKEMIL